MRRGFTLVELTVVVSLMAILAALSLGGLQRIRGLGERGRCFGSLRQLGVATSLYLGENNQIYFPYTATTPEGTLWYFGLETGGAGKGEGNRELDVTRSPLYPYLQRVGNIEVCLAFPYGSALWKPKFKGASYGYGYNTLLSRRNALSIERPGQVIVFGDCAQVNTFQAPASPSKPMIEEFYMIENTFKTIHFRHNDSANILFADGHVEAMTMYAGTGDSRVSGQKVGRISPVGSMDYLW